MCTVKKKGFKTESRHAPGLVSITIEYVLQAARGLKPATLVVLLRLRPQDGPRKWPKTVCRRMLRADLMRDRSKTAMMEWSGHEQPNDQPREAGQARLPTRG
jgi:hypothetical protein